MTQTELVTKVETNLAELRSDIEKFVKENAKFKVGDVVLSANQVKLSSVEKFSDAVASAKKNGKKSVLLFINRQDQALFIPFPISEK